MWYGGVMEWYGRKSDGMLVATSQIVVSEKNEVNSKRKEKEMQSIPEPRRVEDVMSVTDLCSSWRSL